MKATLSVHHQRQGQTQCELKFIPQSNGNTDMGRRLSEWVDQLPAFLETANDPQASEGSSGPPEDEVPTSDPRDQEIERLSAALHRGDEERGVLQLQVIEKDKELTAYRIQERKAREAAELGGLGSSSLPKTTKSPIKSEEKQEKPETKP